MRARDLNGHYNRPGTCTLSQWRIGILLLWSTLASAQNWTPSDPFNTLATAPTSPSGQLMTQDREEPCDLGPLGTPLTLLEATERALCYSPRTRNSWANIKVQAAQLGQSKASYLPTLAASVARVSDHSSSTYNSDLVSNTDTRSQYNTETLSLNWLLFDFGARSAAVKNAKDLLAAAEANHDAQLQQVFASTARDYYVAIAGQANIEATRATEGIALQGLDIASTRVKEGLSAISDQWQAQTTAAQSTFNRVRAEGEYKKALGTLAIDMGLAPDTPIQLTQDLDGARPNTDFIQSIQALLTQAQRAHPSLIAARAQVDAAQAHVKQATAQGRPTVNLVMRRSGNNQPVSLGTGLPTISAQNNDTYLGIEVNIPIFEGFGRHYQQRAAQAEVERQAANLQDAEQQVSINVWNSYQTLQVETENLHNTDVVLDSAKRALTATQYRYQKGVGGLLELLNSQNGLANALLQHIQAQTNWRNARLQLAASLGQLTNLDLLRP